jgi:hypothetical protein
MESQESGAPAGAGSSGRERSPAFGETVEVAPPPEVDAEPPEWLDEARDGLEAGEYLAYEDEEQVRTVPVAEGWTRIGRSLSAEVRIDDPTVSRRHALIHRDGGTVRVLDDRSLNGVLHNGRRVDLQELEDGDVLAIGRYELRFLRLAGDREHALV